MSKPSESASSHYKPPYIVIDFETSLDGKGSTEFWHPRFRVDSMAASWRAVDNTVKSIFLEGEDVCLSFLKQCEADSLSVVAYNIQFEMGVCRCRFPELRLSWLADTMRLVQVYDNGGDKFALEAPISIDAQLDQFMEDDEKVKKKKPKFTAGLGLVKALKRILKAPDHKEPAYLWLRTNISECREGREGQFLNRLPSDLLRAYNIGDTEATLKLHEFLLDYYTSIAYNWRLDHQLYLNSVRLIVDAKVRGVRVDREALDQYCGEVEREIQAIAIEFRARFEEPIVNVERERRLKRIRKLKSLRGRKKFIARYRAGSKSAVKDVVFNVGSNKQLSALFVDQLNIRPTFTTDKGAPSFKSAVLSQWGDGGEILKRRRKRLLVLKQATSLLTLSDYDGRWHVDLKSCGTATGRFSGGSH